MTSDRARYTPSRETDQFPSCPASAQSRHTNSGNTLTCSTSSNVPSPCGTNSALTLSEIRSHAQSGLYSSCPSGTSSHGFVGLPNSEAPYPLINGTPAATSLSPTALESGPPPKTWTVVRQVIQLDKRATHQDFQSLQVVHNFLRMRPCLYNTLSPQPVWRDVTLPYLDDGRRRDKCVTLRCPGRFVDHARAGDNRWGRILRREHCYRASAGQRVEDLRHEPHCVERR